MNNELTHHGVKGMRWGVRKKQPSTDYTEYKKIKKKKLKEMSNEELKKLNNRMNLEANYRELKKRNVSAGRKFVTNVLSGTATAIATKYATKYAEIGVKKVVKLGIDAVKK